MVKDKIVNGWGDSGRGGSIDELRAFWEVCDELSVNGEFICRGEKIIPPGAICGKII